MVRGVKERDTKKEVQKKEVHGMQIEFKKDLRHNYMVISASNIQPAEDYCINMLEHQNIEGMLSMERRQMDNTTRYYYDITAKQSMTTILDKSLLNYQRLRQLCTRLISIIEGAYDYLLPEDGFLLSPEYLYLDLVTDQPFLCYVPGYSKDIMEQMSSLMEYLMNKVDYNDKEAVLLVYQLFAVSKEEGFTFEHLQGVLEKNTNNSVIGRDYRDNQSGIAMPDHVIQHKLLNDNNIKTQIPKIQSKAQAKSELGDNSKVQLKVNPEGPNRPSNQGRVESKINSKMINQYGLKLAQRLQTLRKPVINNKENNKTNLNNKETQSEINFSSMKQKGTDKNDIKKIPVMMEKIENEQEIPYYPLITYVYTGITITGGSLAAILCLTTKVLYNSFGNRLDITKVFALLLIIFCVEGYLLKLIWDKKNQITKIISTAEYIDPRQDYDEIDTMSQKKYLKPWNSGKHGVGKLHYYASDYSVGTEEKKAVEENTAEENHELFDVDNPTCLLNASDDLSDEKKVFILKPVDELNYKTIIIKDIPFFIGKLKKNVDYCLENDVVSRYHAKITKEKEQYYITDLNSTNGTYVNNEVLQTYQKKKLIIGDEVIFANIKYIFRQQG